MTDTPNLGMPYIDGSQAQKHVTHNEALRILDAAIQIAVLDLTRTAPPPSPSEGERHVVADGATGAWAGQDKAIATWQDGAWAFLAPKTGWCIWSIADDVVFVFDGAVWRDLRDLPTALDNATHIGINTTAASPNLLSVKSNAALIAAIAATDGGTGDVRLQLSKETAGNTASVVFSENFSGRAEFGLAGSDNFKLKVSADGSAWTEAFTIAPDTGNLTLPCGLALTGVISPAQITADQDDYDPAGLSSASVMQISSDAARAVTGLAGGAEGRLLSIINAGSQPVTLRDENALSAAANRLSLGYDLVIAGKQAAILRYDGTASRWRALTGAGLLAASRNLSDVSSPATARANLGVIYPPQGRLTLQSGVPVMTATQSGKTTLYYTPYAGNQIPIYNGSNMVPTAFSELSAATTDTSKNPAAIGPSKVNDWFVWDDGGTLRLIHGPDWTDDVTRSAGSALVTLNGIAVNNAAITNGPAAQRGTWIGTTRSNASSQLDFTFGGNAAGGAAAFFGIWNAYNRVAVAAAITDSTNTWTYNTAAWRPANNSSGMRVSFVTGAQEDFASASYSGLCNATASTGGAFGIGYGSTSAFVGTTGVVAVQTASASQVSAPAFATVQPFGFGYLQALEYTSVGTTTFSGDAGTAYIQTGLCVQLRM